MSSIVGEKCSQCGKVHLVKSEEIWNSLSPKDRLRAYKTMHRIFRDGYLRSLDMNVDSETEGTRFEVWEFYSALSIHKLEIVEEKEKEEKEKEHCLSCLKEISKEEFEHYNGLCENCYIEWES
jgi:hypothetical protein